MATLSSIRDSFYDVTSKLGSALDDICAALEDKGVTVPEGAKLADVPELINDVAFYSPGTTIRYVIVDGSKIAEMTERLYGDYDLCARFSKLEDCAKIVRITIDPGGFREGSSNCRKMFSNCSALTSLTLPDGFGANVTNCAEMFSNCSALTSLTLPDGFGANVTRAISMFDGCAALKSIAGALKLSCDFDLSQTDVVNGENGTGGIVYIAENLPSVDTEEAPVLSVNSEQYEALKSAGYAYYSGALLYEKGWGVHHVT